MATTPGQLRAAFADWPSGSQGGLPPVVEVVDPPVPPEITARLRNGHRPAAVLIPLVQSPLTDSLHIILTQRTAHLRDHAGQISFPGGGLDPGESPAQGALREAQEEIGLAPGCVEIFGQMPQYLTGTGFAVSPMLGFVHPPYQLQPQETEVAQIFNVPLDFVLDPKNYRQVTRFYRGGWRTYWSVPWSGYDIWGATAGMLKQLSQILHNA